MTALPPPRTRAYWLCQSVGWGLYVFVTAWQMHRDPELGGGGRFLVEPLLAAALGIALTHAYRRWARQKNWLALGGGAVFLRVVLGGAAIDAIFVALLGAVEFVVYRDHHDSYALTVVGALLRWVFVFWIWTAIYFGLGAVRRREDLEILALRLEKERNAAVLRALEAQMNPHFLFNALNSIRALVVDEPARAQDAITELSRMLRYTLRTGDEDLVRLDRELETVDDYLALEALRLGPRLVVRQDVSEEARQAQVPVMLLLTLVDNAIKHGVAQLAEGGTLNIRASVGDASDRNALLIDVEQPRPVVASALANGAGIGVANVQARLALLYGKRASFRLDLSRAGHAHAHVRLPAGTKRQ